MVMVALVLANSYRQVHLSTYAGGGGGGTW
jgi:hypothetical protein